MVISRPRDKSFKINGVQICHITGFVFESVPLFWEPGGTIKALLSFYEGFDPATGVSSTTLAEMFAEEFRLEGERKGGSLVSLSASFTAFYPGNLLGADDLNFVTLPRDKTHLSCGLAIAPQWESLLGEFQWKGFSENA